MEFSQSSTLLSPISNPDSPQDTEDLFSGSQSPGFNYTSSSQLSASSQDGGNFYNSSQPMHTVTCNEDCDFLSSEVRSLEINRAIEQTSSQMADLILKGGLAGYTFGQLPSQEYLGQSCKPNKSLPEPMLSSQVVLSGACLEKKEFNEFIPPSQRSAYIPPPGTLFSQISLLSQISGPKPQIRCEKDMSLMYSKREELPKSEQDLFSEEDEEENLGFRSSQGEKNSNDQMFGNHQTKQRIDFKEDEVLETGNVPSKTKRKLESPEERSHKVLLVDMRKEEEEVESLSQQLRTLNPNKNDDSNSGPSFSAVLVASSAPSIIACRPTEMKQSKPFMDDPYRKTLDKFDFPNPPVPPTPKRRGRKPGTLTSSRKKKNETPILKPRPLDYTILPSKHSAVKSEKPNLPTAPCIKALFFDNSQPSGSAVQSAPHSRACFPQLPTLAPKSALSSKKTKKETTPDQIKLKRERNRISAQQYRLRVKATQQEIIEKVQDREKQLSKLKFDLQKYAIQYEALQNLLARKVSNGNRTYLFSPEYQQEIDQILATL